MTISRIIEGLQQFVREAELMLYRPAAERPVLELLEDLSRRLNDLV